MPLRNAGGSLRKSLLVVFRRPPNVKDSLVKAKLPRVYTELAKGCFRCGKSRCQVCSLISEGNSSSCNVCGNQYSVSSSFNCDSSGVVYLLGCRVPGEQYVGSTFMFYVGPGLTPIGLRVESFLLLRQLLRQIFLNISQKLTIQDF